MQRPIAEVKLTLSSGLRWALHASGQRASSVLQALTTVARLDRTDAPADRVLVVHDDAEAECAWDGCPRYQLFVNPNPGLASDFRAVDMARASSVLVAETPGALLVHAALAEYDGRGVLLAGPSGTGKTTASQRLPSPWRSLSDDVTLVIARPSGGFAAHPWPTWSRLILDRSDEAWDVQRWVPLEHILFLSRSDADFVEPVGRARALCLILEAIEQCRGYLPPGYRTAWRRLQALDTACRLVQATPTSILHISCNGPFWMAMQPLLSR